MTCSRHCLELSGIKTGTTRINFLVHSYQDMTVGYYTYWVLDLIGYDRSFDRSLAF